MGLIDVKVMLALLHEVFPTNSSSLSFAQPAKIRTTDESHKNEPSRFISFCFKVSVSFEFFAHPKGKAMPCAKNGCFFARTKNSNKA